MILGQFFCAIPLRSADLRYLQWAYGIRYSQAGNEKLRSLRRLKVGVTNPAPLTLHSTAVNLRALLDGDGLQDHTEPAPD